MAEIMERGEQLNFCKPLKFHLKKEQKPIGKKFLGFVNPDLSKYNYPELKDSEKEVEEICDHIALINNSEKILDGKVSKVKEQFSSGIFEVEFEGSMIGFTNALWTGFELLSSKDLNGVTTAKIKALNNNTPNTLLQSIVPHVEVRSFKQDVPSMNEIFIRKVNEMNLETAEKNG